MQAQENHFDKALKQLMTKCIKYSPEMDLHCAGVHAMK